MKRLRRMAALVLALILGVVAWCAIAVSLPSSGELRLSRELSTGWVVTRVPRPKPILFGLVVFGPAKLDARYEQPGVGNSAALPQGIVFEADSSGKEQIWYVGMDPLDKSWEIEVKESRVVYLRLGKKNWRIGTKTRVWRTQRRGVRDEVSFRAPETSMRPIQSGGKPRALRKRARRGVCAAGHRFGLDRFARIRQGALDSIAAAGALLDFEARHVRVCRTENKDCPETS